MTFKIILSIFGFAYLVHQFEFYPGSMAFCGVTLVSIVLNFYLQRRAERKFLATNHELMFIVSSHPEDGREIEFDPIIEKYVKHVPHHRVNTEVRRIKDLYEDLDNPWWNSDKHGENAIKVIPLVYTHGKGVVFTWDEFALDCHNIIKEAVKVHHEYLVEYDPYWYAENSDNQKAYSGLYLSLSRLFVG